MQDFGVIGKYQSVKQDKEYPWGNINEPVRTIMIYKGDILNRSSQGVFTKRNGLCFTNIHIPEEDIIEKEDNNKHLVLV